MTLISMDRFGQRNSSTGADEVLLGWPIPGEAQLVGLDAQIHIIGSTLKTLPSVMGYGIDAYLLPLLDPDGHDNLDTIWDELVPKSTPDLSFELSDTADSSPVWEPGDVTSEFFTGIMVGEPKEIYSRRQWLSYASNPNGTYDRTTSDWFPTDFLKINVDTKYFCSSETALLIGISTPSMDQDISDAELLPGAQTYEWLLMKYIDATQLHMLDLQTGLFTEGTGSFGLDEAEDFLEGLVSDWNQVDSANFQAYPTAAAAMGNARVVVPGERVVKVVAPGN